MSHHIPTDPELRVTRKREAKRFRLTNEGAKHDADLASDLVSKVQHESETLTGHHTETHAHDDVVEHAFTHSDGDEDPLTVGSTTAKGVYELATAAETSTGTDTARVIPVVALPIQLQDNKYTFVADTASDDTYLIAPTPVIAAYATGQMFHFTAQTKNTGAATLNVNGKGAKTIKKLHDQDLANDDIEAGQIVTVIYDGTNFQMQSQLAASGGGGQDLDSDTLWAAQGDIVHGTADDTAAVLSAGTDGQALVTKGSSANPVFAGQGILQYHRTGGGSFYAGHSLGAHGSTAVVVDDQLYAVAIDFPVATAADRVQINVTAFSGASHPTRVGIYNAGTNLYPGTLLEDGGSQTITATGLFTYTVSQTLQGLYWLAILSDRTADLGSITVGAASGLANWFPLGKNNAGTVIHTGWKVAQTFGALPDPFTASGTIQTAGVPGVAVRVT